MDILGAVRAGTASVVVIDDLFAPPDLRHIPAANRHDLIDRIENSAEDKAALQRILAAEGVEDEARLVELATERAATLWTLYADDPLAHSFLQPLFESFEAERAEAVRLRQLVRILTDAFGRAPSVFSSLQDAKEELGRCAIAFVDIFMGAAQTIGEILELHAAYNPQYREFRHEDQAWPKLIVLISTRMPGNEQLRSFRQGAGIRTAFFKPLEKNQISAAEINGILQSWAREYAAAANLNRYLNELSAIVNQSAVSVVQDIDQIELHDLAVLDAARLFGDGASLHSYVSWLTAELLASRARNIAARHADDAPERATEGAVDPMLVRESVLFDLFADVTGMPPGTEGAPQFGEILVPTASARAAEMPVLVALSPACDLARCTPEYEVLLLKGTMTPSGRTASELLQLGAVFGKGKHLLNYRIGDNNCQGVIKWNTKQGLITRPAGDLAKVDRYLRLGRMAELFAYEVKEIAISQVSRIGLPVAPSVQLAASVCVRARFDMGQGQPRLEFTVQGPAAPTVCALITRGRMGEDAPEAELVMLTEQFRVWFIEFVLPQLRAAEANTKIAGLIQKLTEWSDWRVRMDSSTGKPFADLTVKFDGPTLETTVRGLEIVITPQ